MRIARYYCPTAHETFSLLPDCLASRFPSDLDDLERVVIHVEAARSVEAADDVLAVLLVVGVISAGVGVQEAVFERAIHEDGEFARRRGDGFGFADAKGDAAVEGPKSGLGAAEVHRGESKDRGGPVGGRWRSATEEAPAGHLVVRRQG
jgi:hypothetical protein